MYCECETSDRITHTLQYYNHCYLTSRNLSSLTNANHNLQVLRQTSCLHLGHMGYLLATRQIWNVTDTESYK